MSDLSFSGSYEIVFFSRDENADELVGAIWDCAELNGPYLEKGSKNNKKFTGCAEDFPKLYGVAKYFGVELEVSTCVVTDNDGTWVYLSLSLKSLSSIFDLGSYPIEDGKALDWAPKVDEFFLKIGRKVYSTVQFDGAIIGWLTLIEVDELLSYVENGPRLAILNSYILSSGGKLDFYPATQRMAPIIID